LRQRNWQWLVQRSKDTPKEQWSTMQHYENARSFVNFILHRKWMDTFKEHCNAIALYDDPRLSTERVLTYFHAFSVTLKKYEGVDDELLLLTLLEGVRFILPSLPTAHAVNGVHTSGRAVNFIFEKSGRDELFELLEIPMNDSVVISKKPNKD
jgi:hypothetical protein